MRFAKTAWMNSLSVKVLLAYVAGTALTITLIGLIISVVVSVQGDILPGAEVSNATKDMSRNLRFNGDGAPVGFEFDDFESLEWVFDSLRQETAYRVLDASGQVVMSSAAGEDFWSSSEAAGKLQSGRFDFKHQGVAMHGATEVFEREGKVWYFQFAASSRFLDLSYQAFAYPMTGAGIALFSLVLLFVFGACAYLTLRYALRPLREISDSAAAISSRSLHARLNTERVPTEIAPLVDSFNRVLERLEHGYRIQQEFLATAAHELKTPLALIRAQIELMDDDKDRKPLLNDVGHMTRQVQQLLHLAEASEIQNYNLILVDVRSVAQEVVDYLQRMANAAGVHLVVAENGSAPPWLADRGALFTLFKNMLENAIQHAPAGTEVRVAVGASEVSIRDWGPGVTQEQLPKIFLRFWRGPHRRDHGAGLGLVICQEIALAHGWRLSAHREEPGLRFSLSLSAGTSPVAQTRP
jgi:signal transduction histidine kinase